MSLISILMILLILFAGNATITLKFNGLIRSFELDLKNVDSAGKGNDN